jgi:hypothetical protein
MTEDKEFDRTPMNRKIQDSFIYSVAVILFVTASAKIFTATSKAQALRYPDWLFTLSNRNLFYVTGGIELAISVFLLMKNGGQRIKLALIAWLSTLFLAYRAGFWWQGVPNLCDCLGNLNQKLPVSPRTVNFVMLAVLIWLFVGSYLLLIVDIFSQSRLSSPRLSQAQKGGGMNM